MKRSLIPLTLLTSIVCLSIIPVGTADPEVDHQEAAIERGRYLAYGVAMCVDCHSPKMSNGLLDPERVLMGTPVTTIPIEPVADWVGYAPPIAGLPNYDVEEVVEVLTTGMIGNVYLRPPMPVYRMSEEDARAIALYLKSLASPEPAP